VNPPSAAREDRRNRFDAHVHLSRWWPEVRRTGYREDLHYTVRGLLREMDQAGIQHAAAIQMFFAPSEVDALAEGQATLQQSGGRLLPVATVDPTRGEGSVAATLEAVEKAREVIGLKIFPGYRPFYPHDRRLDPVYEFAHRRRLPVLVHLGDTLDGLGLLKFARPIEMDEVAGRFRDVRFVLCHLGNPWIEEAAGVLYKNPNVYADTSGLLPSPRTPYFDRAVERTRRLIEEVVVGVGSADRILFGSDWPLEELKVAVSLIQDLPIPEGERRAILGGNARALFGVSGEAGPWVGQSRTTVSGPE